ncbi:MAG: hypothetical protein XD73_0515 [Anaerolinea thermophila]|uniref:Methyltransferase type 11 domain-containing protein n=1 Tax=Anaerolinea thermophila TaxID=167964 RepID=A0A101FYC4_9CHLR|nr:MAG: hypothetical protein XD73_0515 [Anaerolinea thermophila]
MTEKNSADPKKDYLWENLRQLPYFRGFLRAVEGRFYEEIELIEPILDVGCGDGVFAAITFEKPLKIGFDPSLQMLGEAASNGAYGHVLCAGGGAIPFEDASYATVISNSVLEHIPMLDEVIEEVYRVLKPGGQFIFCVPNDNLLKNLSVSNFFDSIKLHGLANAYRSFFNTISRHHHADPFEVWEPRLRKHHFHIVHWWNYFSPDDLHTLEWGHYRGLHSLLNKKIFKKWVLFPYHGNFFIPERSLRKKYNQDPIHPEGSYTFYITRKE